MSKSKTVQKKALKKRAVVNKYPLQVATRSGQKPMSNTEFLRYVADWAGFHAGKSFSHAMTEMICSTFDGKFSKKQYDMLDAAIETTPDQIILSRDM